MKRSSTEDTSSSSSKKGKSSKLTPSEWHIVENDALMVKIANPTSTSVPTSSAREGKMKIFAFDMDGCIIETKSGNSFAKDKNDWRFFQGRVCSI